MPAVPIVSLQLRPALLALLVFLAVQSVLLIHQQDLVLHDHDVDCAICVHSQPVDLMANTELLPAPDGHLSQRLISCRQYGIVPTNFPSGHLARAPPGTLS